MSIAIFFGTTTGNTEHVAEMIRDEMGDLVTCMADIAFASPSDFLKYDVLLFGIPTWDIGELQGDWEDFIPRLEDVDLAGKKIALFGCGDSYSYSENFLDAFGLLWDELKKRGEPELIGLWPTEGYSYEASKGEYDCDYFLGLGLDEENEPELHEERIKAWTTQLKTELGLG